MDNELRPLDYRSPFQPPRASRELFSLPEFYAGFTVATAIAVILFFVAPRFEQIFRDFGVKLPLLTVLLLRTSRFAVRWWWLVLSMLIVLPVAVGFLGALLPPAPPEPPDAPRRRRRTKWLTRLTLLCLTAVILVTVLALFLPMISLIEAVSGSGKK